MCETNSCHLRTHPPFLPSFSFKNVIYLLTCIFQLLLIPRLITITNHEQMRSHDVAVQRQPRPFVAVARITFVVVAVADTENAAEFVVDGSGH